MWKGRAALGNRKGEEHGSVTPFQLMAVIAGAVIGVGVLAFPRFILTLAGTGGPLATLLGVIPAAVGWLGWVQVYRFLPKATPAEADPKILSPWLGFPMALSGALWLILVTALALREFGEVLKAAILSNTPIEVTTIALLLTCAYFVRYDLQVFVRVFEVFFPVMVVPLTLLGLLALKNMKTYYLLPVTGVSWQGVLEGALMASVGYIALVIGPFLLPSLSRPRQALKAGFWGLGISLFLYTLVVTATLGVFGPEEVKRLVWPTFELIKITTVPGFVLERMESAFIGIWVAAVFTTVGATYYAAVLCFQQLFRFRDHKVMVIPLVPVIYMTALVPDDLHTMYDFVRVLGLYGVALIFVKPVVLALIWYLRQSLGGQSGATQAK